APVAPPFRPRAPFASILGTVTNVSLFRLRSSDLSVELLLRVSCDPKFVRSGLLAMPRFSRIRVLQVIALLAVFGPLLASAQDDPDEIPLGGVARNLRKKTPPAKPVIDDDNLSQVMQEADAHHEFGSGLRFLMSGSRRGFNVEAPDVTCSLSFTANVKSLLSGQYAEMEVPPSEMSKVEGKAVVEGDALTIPVFNGTQWHLSELTIAFTVIRKGRSGFGQAGRDLSSIDPIVQELPGDAFAQVRPEKKADLTVIYRMRA